MFPLDLLRSFFSVKTTLPPADVHIIPCSGLDVAARDLILTTGLIIDARLDVKKLEDSLTTLIKHKFPRAGARLALRNGVYEYQVPRTFDSKTPVVFTAEDFAEPYRSETRPDLPTHLEGSLPSVYSVPPAAFEVYLKSAKCPASVEELLVPNTPLLQVHVAVFDDITFIGVTSSHLLFDALGTGELLRAWTRMLDGEDINAIPGMEIEIAPFEGFAAPTKVKHQRGWFVLGLLGQLLFIVRLILRLFRDPKEQAYLIRVPKVFLEVSKHAIMENLQLQGSAEWVGSSDVLLAWWFKSAYSHRRPSDTTPIHIHLAVNLRGKPIFPGDSTLTGPYIHNAVSSIPIPAIPVNAFRKQSLGEIALRIRRAILAYNADLPGIQADMQWRCANPLKVPFPCSARGEYTFHSNWRSARLGDLDFSGASTSVEKVRVLLSLGYVVSGKGIPMRGAGADLMEDADAIWMNQIRGAKDWENIRRSGSIVFL
ncbi:hypothetical protein C8F04DRAFT_1040926 [Mycena alexandri]|uniref:Uncharacterized protein n=1 Tax=Mycena alexandri TaxID=1745969 RepID=A0AAD6SQS4_9AGAR|nr:hypothetical protein C8F04DRAFT_1040926 [Mycena alexandri]